jgi:hypothetical protein
LGTVISKVADFKTKQLECTMAVQQAAHDVEMAKVKMEMMAQQGATDTKIEQVKADGAAAVADAGTLKSAVDAEANTGRFSVPDKITTKQEWLFVIIDAIRAMVRPGLTIYLCAVTTLMYLQAKKLMGNAMLPEQAALVLKEIINTVLYLTTTCVLFWFGTRSRSSPSSGS